MKLKLKGEKALYVVRDGEDTCRAAEEGDIGICLAREQEDGTFDVLEPKPWAASFPLKAMRRFMQDANYKPWTSENRPHFLDAIYFC